MVVGAGLSSSMRASMVASSCQLPMRSASVFGYELLALLSDPGLLPNLHLGVEIACSRGNCTGNVCQPGQSIAPFGGLSQFPVKVLDVCSSAGLVERLDCRRCPVVRVGLACGLPLVSLHQHSREVPLRAGGSKRLRRGDLDVRWNPSRLRDRLSAQWFGHRGRRPPNQLRCLSSYGCQ